MGRAAGRALILALLTAANASFLWMFLSTDPLEQMAAEIQATRGQAAVDAFLRGSLATRHGWEQLGLHAGLLRHGRRPEYAAFNSRAMTRGSPVQGDIDSGCGSPAGRSTNA